MDSGGKKREFEISINLSMEVSAKNLRALARCSRLGHRSPRMQPLVHSSWQLTWRDMKFRDDTLWNRTQGYYKIVSHDSSLWILFTICYRNKKRALSALFLLSFMRSERLELSQLSPPPPQDGVSTIPPWPLLRFRCFTILQHWCKYAISFHRLKSRG